MDKLEYNLDDNDNAIYVYLLDRAERVYHDKIGLRVRKSALDCFKELFKKYYDVNNNMTFLNAIEVDKIEYYIKEQMRLWDRYEFCKLNKLDVKECFYEVLRWATNNLLNITNKKLGRHFKMKYSCDYLAKANKIKQLNKESR